MKQPLFIQALSELKLLVTRDELNTTRIEELTLRKRRLSENTDYSPFSLAVLNTGGKSATFKY